MDWKKQPEKRNNSAAAAEKSGDADRRNKRPGTVMARIMLILLTVSAVFVMHDEVLNRVTAAQEQGKMPLTAHELLFTRYAGTSGMQSMFYTAVDRDGNLILIDGGWHTDGDIEQIRSVVSRHDNHISLWILTHPHPDHVGAFVGYMEKYGHDTAIDRIYVPPVNSKLFYQTASQYDDPDTFRSYEKMISGMDQVTFLHDGDEIDLAGTKMKVLHSWDELTEKQTENLLNQGSLMFRISGRHKSVLFCADTMEVIAPELMDEFGDELRSDYVQCGHHGNNGLYEDFYELVDPDTALFEAPVTITQDETGKFDAPRLITWFINRGTQVIDWNTSPYSFLIY